MIPGVLVDKRLQLLPAAGFCALSFRLSRPILFLIGLLNLFAIVVNLF
jgi:hypothetical protein